MKLTTLSTFVVAAVAASQLGATDCGQITRDPGFDLWCGDRLCYWTTDKGQVERVPTWIEGDDGVSLVGDDVEISQMTAVTSQDTQPSGCIEFDMTAKIDTDAEVDLDVDLFGDGTTDYQQRIPTSDWEKQVVSIGWAGSFEGIKFHLVKRGSGQAILADMTAKTADTCPPPMAVPPRPSGAECTGSGDCASGLCVGFVCSACGADTDCAQGDVCGRAREPGWLQPSYECIPAASRQSGELCAAAEECASGACANGLCQECIDGSTCAQGQHCAYAASTEIGECSPGAHDRTSGASCVIDQDCASGVCSGDTHQGYCTYQGQLLSDRPCFGDVDCPLDPTLAPATCTFVAVAGGTCQ